MKKTAKQMFEELGYEVEERQDYINYFKESGADVLTEITFNKEYNYIRMYSYDSVVERQVFAIYVTPEELQAINKQVEEFGWGKEEENEN